jgi:hypothetical protein
MSYKTKFAVRLFLPICILVFLPFAAISVQTPSADLNLEARLIWGTNEKESPNPKHKRIDTPLTEKLSKVFKWQHYFEVNRHVVTLSVNRMKKVEMSPKCVVEIKHLGNSRVEVKLFGEDKFVSQTTETLPKGEWLVLAGSSKNDTAWFVVLKAIESK